MFVIKSDIHPDSFIIESIRQLTPKNFFDVGILAMIRPLEEIKHSVDNDS